MSEDLKQPLIKQEQKKVQLRTVSYFSLFRYADKVDKMFLFFGSLAALCAGASTPFFVIFFGDITQIFVTDKRDQSESAAFDLMVKFFIIGAATWFLNFVGIYSWNRTGSRQALRLKKIYYQTLLQQEIAWYDSNDVNKLATQISGSMVAIETAIGEKVAILMNVTVTTIFGFFYAFFKCWRLSVMLLASLPLLMIAGVLMMKGMTLKATMSKVSFENASGIAEQAFGGIKTVKSLVGEIFEHNRFIKALSKDQSSVTKYSFISAMSFGIMNLIFLCLYSFGFWYGKQILIWFPEYTASTIISTFFCFLIGGASVGQISPILKNIAEGKVAGAKLFSLLKRQKSLKQPEDGVKINKIDQISLSNVHFKYEKVDDESNVQGDKSESSQTVVLDSVNLKIPNNKVTALVGESGSGKSTIIQLLLRYYDPTTGSIKVNGVDLPEVDMSTYRRKIGFVGQEPVLFSMSVAENIRLSNPNLNDDQVRDILRRANALSFIQSTQEGIDTYVGTSGTQFSGGQKQRIAIARAIAKNPSLLVLDEATSALDRKNQKQIQKTLSSLSSGQITTVVVAHRLTTIRNADNIIVMKRGKIVEQGTHEELIEMRSAYYELVKSQMSAESKEEESELIEDTKTQSLSEEKNQSMKKEEKEEKKKQQFTKEQLSGVFGKLFKESSSNFIYILIGSLSALINGLIWPFFNVAFSNILALLAFAEQNSEEIDKYCLLFLLIAVGGGLATFSYQFNFSVAGERLVYSLRTKLFKKILNLPVPYFDKAENTPGAISTKLSQNTYDINNMITGVLAVVCLNFSTIFTSLFLAFYNSWQLTLIVMVLTPLLVITSAINMSMVKNLTQKSSKYEKQVGSLISDSVCNARTLKSFGNDELFAERFNSRLTEISKIDSDKAFKTSFLQGLSRASVMFVEGLTFYIASILFANSIINDPQSIYIAIFSIIFAAMGVGQNSQFMPDIGKCQQAGASVFEILERKDQLQIAQQTQDRMVQKFEGDIEFKNVVFKYPERDALVLNNFTLKIKKGEKIGFVGPSGSGKSTIIQLLLRFYEIESGQILIDGKDIKKYNLLDYRRQIGLVSQEPTLFQGTVKDNIIYNQENQADIQNKLNHCTKIAHAHNFINEWEEKLEKDVGQKGSQVSGGQKQRLALSRCLLRNPTLFLLDESTSALDTDTEKIVFENLKPILKNHTSISIAHRLSTIEDADRIIVMRDGRIIEEGNYHQLMEMGENFYRLAKGIN